MKKDTIILPMIMMMILFYGFVSIASSAYERTAYDQALTASWHPGSYCIPCHFSIMDVKKAQNLSNTCRCHEYRPVGKSSGYSVNMTTIYNMHKDIICIRCHIGMKNQQNVTAQDFHRIMQIDCSNCHKYVNGTYQIPEKKNCSDCHADGNPHIVHGTKINRLCIACHGEEFAKKYINKTIEISDKGMVILPSNVTIEREYPTITEFLGKILGIIMRI